MLFADVEGGNPCIERGSWGGREVVTYAEMLDAMADALGKRRRPRLPLLTPRLSSLWIGLVTPVEAGVARPLIESLSSPTVVPNRSVSGRGFSAG